ncbi:MAG TPA: hypothetical protein VI821_00760 [Candidatus Paceibacterota bacterium]
MAYKCVSCGREADEKENCCESEMTEKTEAGAEDHSEAQSEEEPATS